MRTLLFILFFNLSLFAYTENFNAYDDGVSSNELNASGITFSSQGRWEVFTTPFSVFSTPVLLEPSSILENNPLTISFDTTQCQMSLDFATDGEDRVDVEGFYRGETVFHKLFSGENRGGSYVGSFTINTKVDSVKIYTVDRKRVLIDNITTSSCSLNNYSVDEGIVSEYSFEESDSKGFSDGIIGKSLSLSRAMNIQSDSDIKGISMWFKIDSTLDELNILQIKPEDGTPRITLKVDSEASIELNFPYELLSLAPYLSNAKIETEKWVHIVLTKEADRFKFYVNGKINNSFINYSKLYEKGEQIIIGDDDFGHIDELRLYNRSITQKEALELYHTRETFTKTYDNGFESGKQFCIDNPQACGLLAGSTDKDISIETDIQTLKNHTFDVSWYLIKADSDKIYLVSGEANDTSVWQMVPDTKQWKPVHNANAFDGFEAQNKTFDYVEISDDAKTIIFGDASKSFDDTNASEEN